MGQIYSDDSEQSWVRFQPAFTCNKLSATNSVRRSLGAQVRRGEQGTPVVFWKLRKISRQWSGFNTSIQRCLVKAIALHGLGLYIYAGEDLPQGESAPPKVAPLSPRRTITVGQQRYLERLLKEAGWSEQRLVDYFGIDAITARTLGRGRGRSSS